MKCDVCDNQASKTAVLDGTFGNYCPSCFNRDKRLAAPGHAEWSRERDREDHRRDMLQPYKADRTPNQAFIQNYPEESQEIFTKEEIEQYG